MGNTTARYVRSMLSYDFLSPDKRKRDSSDEDEEYDHGRVKRRKLRGISVPAYIYKEMFEQGVYSDISIVALGKRWNLHKVHLKQCPYFASMLSGAWKEANEEVITIDVVDPNITVEALDAMFGSLYLDEIELDRKNVIPILAAASHFRMDKLSERCGEIMIEATNHNVALKYYNNAERYGLTKVKEATFDYIVTNIVPNVQLWHMYPQISVELMTSLVTHPDLVVQDSEQNVYMMVLRWLYRCLTQVKEKRRAHSEITAYFSNREGQELLLTEEGLQYQPPFRALNLQAILITHAAIEMLQKNNVIPLEWITSAVMANYLDHLKVNEGMDHGPTGNDIAEIDNRGIRLGRYLRNFGSWHTVGSLNGLILSWTFSNNSLEVTRIRSGTAPDLLSHVPRRRVICKVFFIRLGRPKLSIPARVLSLELGQKVEVYRMPDSIQLPMMLQIRLLTTSSVRDEQEVEPEIIVD